MFDRRRTDDKQSGGGEWIGSIVLAVVFAFVFKTAAFATYHIPSESMVPTLLVGDRVTVSKYAYGWGRYSLPFGSKLLEGWRGRVMGDVPDRGDVVVFMHPRNGERMIKRLIGLPGDRIAVRNGRLILNGRVVLRKMARIYRYREFRGGVVQVSEYTETLPNGVSYPVLHRRSEDWKLSGADMDEVIVPSGHYFMMGDNRNNSSDSRFVQMGFVPADHLIGRGEAILYSLYKCSKEEGTECGEARFATRLR